MLLLPDIPVKNSYQGHEILVKERKIDKKCLYIKFWKIHSVVSIAQRILHYYWSLRLER